MVQKKTWIDKTHKIQDKDYITLLKYAGEMMYPKAAKRWINTSPADGGLRLFHSDPNEVLGYRCDDDLRFNWRWSRTKQIGQLRLWINGRVFYMKITREPGCSIQEHEMWEGML